MMKSLNDAAMIVMTSIGQKTQLFEHMADGQALLRQDRDEAHSRRYRQHLLRLAEELIDMPTRHEGRAGSLSSVDGTAAQTAGDLLQKAQQGGALRWAERSDDIALMLQDLFVEVFEQGFAFLA